MGCLPPCLQVYTRELAAYKQLKSKIPGVPRMYEAGLWKLERKEITGEDGEAAVIWHVYAYIVLQLLGR
jgi:hypothetical protein